ncbi:helix-turn-helix domain-containing protein [Cetobacterium sp. 2A]|uniref:helix-turn-helix domain-containing protein n=1 Tax=Cetobacterium sp. 2A TaxID=2754723 RepID=UPI00163D3753|nr:S24 family peptidase [Cetobacterium sp. 2A]MBC2855320.1 helix-turn-helix domain-containing protein [Cetobacterium sp. 2A]MBC2856802.1 helix-turn-helix domain-containing protein [Cetobacterium sp. 2A]MBC2856843.1 helix-turn-helix domain-containing protein [Cetobacterium sp. 2A]
MGFGETLKKVRKIRKDSLYTLADKLDVSHSYIDKVEKGISPISEKLYNKLISVYDLDADELTLSYLEEKLPNTILEKLVYKNDSLTVSSPALKVQKFKVYVLNSTGDGSLLQEMKTKEMIIPMGIQLKKNAYCIEITGSELEPLFYDEDTLLIEESDDTWQELNKKIIVIEKDGIRYVRKVMIVDYKPKFFALNDIYPPFDDDGNIKCLGVVTRLLSRNLSKIKF